MVARTPLPRPCPQPVPSHSVVGAISPYFAAAYGLPASCALIAWSGDNPCSVAGLGSA